MVSKLIIIIIIIIMIITVIMMIIIVIIIIITTTIIIITKRIRNASFYFERFARKWCVWLASILLFYLAAS